MNEKTTRRILTFLAGKITQTDLDAVALMLASTDEPIAGDRLAKRALAADQRLSQSAKARAAFNERFPNVARIQVV